MNPTEQAWLENRIAAAVADDFYLDRGEERSIKEEAAARGFNVSDTELVLRNVLDQYAAVSERQLVDTLDKWLHQATDNDQKLDRKEERDTLDHVVKAASGKKKGLDPVVAEEYVASFCKANGVKRSGDSNKLTIPLVGVSLLAVLAFSGYALSGKNAAVQESAAPSLAASSSDVKLSADDRADIDDQLRRASAYVQASQFTDPPEKSAKACLDTIKRIDPKGAYRGDEVKALVTAIVNQYMTMADHASSQKDPASARKWIDRAKLFYAESEVIRDKELALGLVTSKER